MTVAEFIAKIPAEYQNAELLIFDDGRDSEIRELKFVDDLEAMERRVEVHVS